jgi:hypothetical protein
MVVQREPPVAVHLQPPNDDVRFCAVSPDGRRVATGNHGNGDGFAAKVWTATGKVVKKLPVPSSPSCKVAFSPDGRWLLTTGGGCRLWKVDSWEEGPKVGGANGCFSPDGRLLAVEGTAGAIRLLRLEGGAEVARLEAPERTRLMPACFTPDGTRLIAVGVDTQALHVWDLAALRRGLVAIGLPGDGLPDAAERAARACSIRRSTDKPELEAVLTLGRAGVKVRKNGRTLLALGKAEYRSGNYAEADAALLATSWRQTTDNSSPVRVTETNEPPAAQSGGGASGARRQTANVPSRGTSRSGWDTFLPSDGVGVIPVGVGPLHRLIITPAFLVGAFVRR